MSLLVTSGADTMRRIHQLFERQMIDEPQSENVLVFYGQVPVHPSNVPGLRKLLAETATGLVLECLDALGLQESVSEMDASDIKKVQSWVYDAEEQP